MEQTKKGDCRKKQYQKISFSVKLSIIDEISNGLISVNHASDLYGISRSSIMYWMKKLSSFTQRRNRMSKDDEIKKLKERIEALEFIKDLQQDVIADFEKITGEELSRKSLPETLANEIARKRKRHTK